MAVGDRSELRLAGPSVVGTTSTTVLTVPSGSVYVTKQILFTNTNGVDAYISLAIGSVATPGNCIFFNLPIAGYDTVVFDTALVLNTAETLTGISDRGGINVTVTGWDKEV